ncbi:MAG: biotin/lipoyl-binding protein [Chloroflexi bacterium]|nr:biotin/lipoyl-binding protein [Chloroflexota bacterium]
MKFVYRVGAERIAFELEKDGNGFRAHIAGKIFSARALNRAGDELEFTVDNAVDRVYIAREGARRWVHWRGRTFVFEIDARGERSELHAQSDENILRAPMPAQVRAVLVKAGDAVEKTQLLILIEAMKMEIRILAPRAGRIAEMLVKAGDLVEREQVLVEIE